MWTHDRREDWKRAVVNEVVKKERARIAKSKEDASKSLDAIVKDYTSYLWNTKARGRKYFY